MSSSTKLLVVCQVCPVTAVICYYTTQSCCCHETSIVSCEFSFAVSIDYESPTS